jgi:hypothetical protein
MRLHLRGVGQNIRKAEGRLEAAGVEGGKASLQPGMEIAAGNGDVR